MKKTLLVLLMLLTMGISGFAQTLSDYVMSTGTDASRWETLSSPTTILELGTATSGDGRASSVINIGFTFNFGGTDYTQFSVNSDGNLRFGSTVTGTANYSTPFSTSNANINNPKINMLGCDGFITDSGYVHHEVIGTAPDRVCVIEFATSTYNTTSRPSLLRWQVQLFETSNEIQIVYPSTMPPILPNVARQPGMCVDNANIILIDASHGASFHNVGSSTNQVPTGTWPDVNRYYHFTIANCHTPSSISVTNITTTDAEISWTAPAGATDFILEYKPANGTWADDAIVENISGTTHSLYGLDPNTYYDVRVANDCGGEQSNYISTTFHTECGILSVSTEPYIEDFEGYATYAFPDCWTRISGYSTTTYDYPYINNAAATAHAGTGYLYAYNNPSNTIVMALPQFTEDIYNLRLDFWMKPAGTTAAYGQVEVGVMSDLTDINTFHALKTWTAVGIGSTTWQEYIVDFDTVTPSNNDHIVIIRRMTSGTTAYGWYFDDVKVMPIPTCEAPTELAMVGATTTSVDLFWNPGEESLFTVYYRAIGDADYQSVSNVSLGADSTYTLDNLNPATNYQWYVASVCSDGSETASNPSVCATTMVPEDLPYTTDFSEGADRSWLLNNGTCTNYWTMGTIPDTTASALYITTNGTNPGYTIASAISTVSAAKLFTVGEDAQFQISFDVMVGGESSFDYIKLFFAPASEMYPASTVAPTTTDYGYNAYSQYAFDFTDYASFSTYTSATTYPYRFNLTNGNVVHIDAIMPNPNQNPDVNSTAQVVFVWRNDNSGGTQPGAIISNVVVAPVSCPSPEDVMISNLSTTSADVSWTDNGVGAWTVEYGIHGFAQGTGTEIPVSGTPEANLSNLTAETTYDVYVTSNCSDGSTSISTFTTFTTPCAPLTTLPFTQNFDNMTGSTSGTTNNLPDCWSHFCNSNSSSYVGYPIVYNSTTYSQSGSNSLRFYAYTSGTTTYGDQIAVLPMIDPTLYPINTLQISFDARIYSTSYPFNLIVGVMGNPTDMATFVAVDTITPSSTTYQNYEIPLNQYTGTGTFIALMVSQPSTSYNAGFVDNIVVDLIPNCPKPTHFAASGVSSNEIELTWTEVGSATEWEIEYGPVGFTPGGTAGTVEPVTNEPPYMINGLTSNTSYDFYIRANCGSEYSLYAPVLTVTTACDAIDSLPWSDFFDTYGTGTTVYPPCWGKINTYTSGDRPYINTTNYSAPGSMYFYTGTSGTYNIAVTPPFDASIPVNTLHATFMYKGSSSTDRLIVGVMTNPADANTFVAIDTIHPASSASTWVEREVIFASYTGNGQYIAFKNAYTTTTAYAYLDNLVIDLIPDCPKPTQIHVVSATTTSIELGWTENGTATSWEIEYGVSGDTLNTIVETATTNPYTIENLSPSTIYDFYISSDCGGSMSEQSAVFTGSTACGAIEQLPYVNGFDAYGTSTSSYPTCWSKINTYTTSDRPYCNSSGAYAGAASLYFYAGTSGTYNIAIMPMIDESIPVNTLQASFMYRATYTTDRLIVGVMTNPNNASTFVAIDTIRPATSATTWVERDVIFASYTGEGHYIAFKNDYTSQAGYAYIDNLIVDEIPTCPKPSQIHVVSATTTSIELEWTENGSASEWEIEYGPVGFTPGTGTLENVTDNPYTVNGLNASTTYDFYFRSVCGSGEYSDFTPAYSAATQCGAIDQLPFTENFDIYGTGTTAYPLCWSKNNTYTSSPNMPYISTTHYAGAGSLYFYTATSGTFNIAITPEFDASIPVNTLQATFMYRASSSTDKLLVGVMTNPNDASTFVPVDTIYPASSAASWVEKEVAFSNYTGNGQYIAFKNAYTTASCYTYIDNLYINLIPNCPKPNHLSVTDITSSSVTLDWQPVGGETSWEIAYGEVGFDPDDATATVVSANMHPFTVQGLTDATSYQFYVRALCSASDQSYWVSQPVNATTLCDGTVSLPYTQDFEGYVGTVYNDANGIAPACWTTFSSNATYGAPHITGSGSYHYVHSGVNCMVFTCSSAGADAYAALPDFDAPLNTLTLKFWRAMESTTQGTLTVGYVTNLSSLSTSFVAVATIPSVGSSAGDTISVDFTGASIPTNGNICFHWNQNGTFYSCCIDDIEVTSNGSAPVVTDPTVATNAASSITQNSATLNGTITNPDGVTITARGFEWKAASASTYTVVTLTGTANTLTHNLTGLTANTAYTYKAFITFNGNTVYGTDMPFTTQEESQPTCNTPTNLTATATAYNAADVTWNAGGNEGAWTLQYKAASETDWNNVSVSVTNYQLTLLTAETEYQVRVQANCYDGIASDWATTSFTTPAVPVDPCDAPTNLQVSNITHNSATASWTPGGNETAWNIQYKLQSASQWQEANVQTPSYDIEGLTANSTYDVRVKAICTADNQSDFVTATFTTLVDAINDVTLAQNINLMPNPADNYIELSINSNVEVKEAVVYNAFGQMIQTVQLTENHARIDLNNMAAGMYFVRVNGEGVTATKKFIKK